MPSVLLVRHGQASFGSADYDVLSELGARQAAATRAALDARGVAATRLVSGAMRRQLDTAAAWGVEPEVDPRLNEYDSEDVLRAHADVPASLEGTELTSRDFQVILDPALERWIAGDGEPEETWAAFRARTTGALRELAASLGSGETAVAVTSGGVIAAMAADLLGLPDTALIALNRTAINGAVTKVISGRRGLSLVSYNEHAHLEPDGLVTYR